MVRITPWLIALLLAPAAATLAAQPVRQTGPTTYKLFSRAAVRAAPGGRVIVTWNRGTHFTSTAASGDWIRISGYFPNGKWRAADRPLWIRRDAARISPPHGARKIARYIVVDKSKFELRVMEHTGHRERVLLRTTVALGRDGCLPDDQGGRCYYTDPGRYHVRWKVHDPRGIKWCIPKFMESEYAEDIARGRRCFRGVIGAFALNIGKSYAIHGTGKPETLGEKVTHGCIRVANGVMQRIYRYMRVGDPVYIRR